VQPETLYARSGDVSIAYQVAGDGPFDLILVPGATSHLELGWQVPSFAVLFERLASFSRLIRFDKRGTGMSDAVVGAPTLEERMDDVRAVMESVGSQRAAIFGVSEGVPMSILFAVTHPERAWALVLYGGMARWVWAPDHPWMPTEAEYRERIEVGRRRLTNRREYLEEYVRSGCPDADEEEARALVEHLRYGASPGAAAALARMNMDIDVRDVLPSVRVPTLVLHRAGDETVRVENGRYIAQRIPGAAYIEFPGPGHWSRETDQLGSEVERFVKGVWEIGGWEESEPDRLLSTVIFTDIVGSSEKAARSATEPGASCSSATTPRYVASSRASAAKRWTRPATASSPPSTGRRGRSAARPQSWRRCPSSACRCGPACTRASAS